MATVWFAGMGSNQSQSQKAVRQRDVKEWAARESLPRSNCQGCVLRGTAWRSCTETTRVDAHCSGSPESSAENLPALCGTMEQKCGNGGVDAHFLIYIPFLAAVCS